jgi:hypothetical protein
MGNIAYPIDLPNPDQIGELANLLSCGLEMHFDIGELDFQASREGLSYIPQTVNAIRAKLEALNSQLAIHLGLEADAIVNQWEKVHFLQKKSNETLWKQAALKYVQDTNFDLIDTQYRHNYIQPGKFSLDIKDLAARYNIEILAFSKSRGTVTCSDIRPTRVYDAAHTNFEDVWEFHICAQSVFITNDTKVGAMNRAKHHWRKAEKLPGAGYSTTVYVMSAATKGKTMDTAGFFAELRQPPADQRMLASELLEKDRKISGKNMGTNVSIMSLQRRGYGGYHKERELVWKDAGKASDFGDHETYYYLPLKGFEVVTEGPAIHNMRQFSDLVTESGIPGLHGITIHGVRKSDIEYIKTQSNWINVQDHIRTVFATLDSSIVRNCALKLLDVNKYFRYNSDIAKLVSANSAYSKFLIQFKGIENVKVEKYNLEKLSRDYATPVDVDTVYQSISAEMTAIRDRYPLLSSLRDYDINADAVAQYINLIDKEA